jgi:hypothetical protein
MAICLIVVRYEGGSSGFNEQNLRKNMCRDSGVCVDYLLNEYSKNDLHDFFRNWNQAFDKIIVHVIAHGNTDGICKLNSDGGDIYGLKESLIAWGELIDWINYLGEHTSNLLLNLGNVCDSRYLLENRNARKFDCIAVVGPTSKTDRPRKINSKWLRGEMEDLEKPYVFATGRTIIN